MSVDYSTTIGYGITIDDDDLPRVLQDASDGGYFGEEEAVAWLEENGFKEIGYSWVGNGMSGPTYVFFHLPRTHIHGDRYDDGGVYFLGPMDLTVDEQREFVKLKQLLGDSVDEPQWLVSFNVS